MFRFTAIARKADGPCAATARMMVPASPGLCEFSTATGMSCSTAGSRVAGCSTFAPKQASSVASWKLISSIRCAFGQIRGSVVRMPLTSVQISIRSTDSAAPMMAAE